MDQEIELLSYFFGAWLGDGFLGLSIEGGKSRYRPGISGTDKEIVTRCYLLIRKRLTDVPDAVISTQQLPSGLTMHKITWESRELAEFLCMATDYRQRLPEYIWSASRESKLEMLAGLMDTDGSISRFKHQNPLGYAYIMQFAGTKGFATEVPELFRQAGIKTGKISVVDGVKEHYLPSTRFNILLKHAVKAGFYFRCQRKMDRLRDYIANYTTEKLYDPPDYGME